MLGCGNGKMDVGILVITTNIVTRTPLLEEVLLVKEEGKSQNAAASIIGLDSDINLFPKEKNIPTLSSWEGTTMRTI